MGKGFLKGVIVGSLVAATVMMAGTALAGTGIGAVFNLGRTNTVNSTTTLTGKASGRMLQVTNKGSGPALGVTVQAGKAPLTVNSTGKVTNLNADALDGSHSTDFVPKSDLATLDAHTLNGKGASDFVLKSDLGTLNADTVDGKHASDLTPPPDSTFQSRQTITLTSNDSVNATLVSIPGFGDITGTVSYGGPTSWAFHNQSGEVVHLLAKATYFGVGNVAVADAATFSMSATWWMEDNCQLNLVTSGRVATLQLWWVPVDTGIQFIAQGIVK